MREKCGVPKGQEHLEISKSCAVKIVKNKYKII